MPMLQSKTNPPTVHTNLDMGKISPLQPAKKSWNHMWMGLEAGDGRIVSSSLKSPFHSSEVLVDSGPLYFHIPGYLTHSWCWKMLLLLPSLIYLSDFGCHICWVYPLGLERRLPDQTIVGKWTVHFLWWRAGEWRVYLNSLGQVSNYEVASSQDRSYGLSKKAAGDQDESLSLRSAE